MTKTKSKMPPGAGQPMHSNAVAEKQSMFESDSMWSQKGATMSDKSARQEFGLTQQEIVAAIRAGKLQYRESSMHGNPWFRLLRHQVESLVPQLVNKPAPKQVADSAKAFVDNVGDVPKLLASSATGNA